MILYVCKTIGYIVLIMYISLKNTGLPLVLFSTDFFWNHSSLPVFIIPADSRLFDYMWYFAMTSLFMEVLVDSSVLGI